MSFKGIPQLLGNFFGSGHLNNGGPTVVYNYQYWRRS